MTHAEQRIEERLTLAGFAAETRKQFFAAVRAMAPRTDSDSEAIRVLKLEDLVGEKWGESSNGNEVWAIYRNRTLATVMLRRSTQPDSNLRVRKVTRL